MTAQRALALTGFCLAVLAAPAAQTPTIERLFEAYSKRDPAAAPQLLTISAEDALQQLERFAPKYLSDRKTADSRRRHLTTFTLELAQAHAERESVSASQLVEWACRYVRRHEPIDEFDRRWQLAATALLEGAINPGALDAHLRHMAAQYPQEPRIALARALVAEQYTAPREVLARGRLAAAAPARRSSQSQASLIALHEEAARRFQELAVGDPSLRAEANVRRARVYVWLARHSDALSALEHVETQTTDPALIYLSRLFRGLALDDLGRTQDAQLAWLSALKIGPGAQSAMMSLATSMFRSGERAAADLMIAKMLEKNDPRSDPWWSYWAGDYRFWYSLIGGVRELTQ